MCFLRHLWRQVDNLKRKLKPALATLRTRDLAMEFCDELDGSDAQPGFQSYALLDMSRLFTPLVAQAGFRLDTFQDLMADLANHIDPSPPEPRDMVLPLLPWAKREPHLRPDPWERPVAA